VIMQIRVDIGKRFGVKFPIFDKIDVNGSGTSRKLIYTRMVEWLSSAL